MAEIKNKVMTIRIAESVMQNLRRAMGFQGVKEAKDNAVLNQFIEKSGRKISVLQLLDEPYPELRKCWNQYSNGTEWTFEQIQLVSHLVRKAYIHSHYRNTVNASYVSDVMKAWLAIYQEYPHILGEMSRYFLSNLPSSEGGTEITAVVLNWIEGLGGSVSSTAAEISSRNLDTTLEELQPLHINVLRLNELIDPYKNTLLKVAFRGCWLDEGRPSREAQTDDGSPTTFSAFSSEPVFLPREDSPDMTVQLSLLVGHSGINGLMYFLPPEGSGAPMSSFTLGFNNSVELAEFAKDVNKRASTLESGVEKGTGYTLLSSRHTSGNGRTVTSHALRMAGRYELSLSHEGLQRVEHVLRKVFQNPQFQQVMEDLSYRYGDV